MEDISEQKQNVNVILVPESILVALSKSTSDGENACELAQSQLKDPSSTQCLPDFSAGSENRTDSKELGSSQDVLLLDNGEGWFVNIDFLKSLKETPHIDETAPQQNSVSETDVINVTNSTDAVAPRKREADKKSFKCTVINCHRKFQSAEELEIHAESHDKQKIHQCQFPGCPWSFSTPYKLRRHASSHQQTKLFKCDRPGCKVSCSTKYNLKAHQQVHETGDKCYCATCNISFNSKPQMLKHMRIKHEKEAALACTHENCDKKFHTVAARTTHMKSHMRAKSICRDCGKEFHKPAALKEHILSKHTNIRPFKCKNFDCSWEFTTKAKLKRHMVIHTGIKSWVCPYEKCSSKFYRKEHLKSHLKIHATNNDNKIKGVNDPDAPVELNLEDMLYYFCPYEDCGSLFASQIGAKQHIQKMHQSSSKVAKPLGVDLERFEGDSNERFETSIPLTDPPQNADAPIVDADTPSSSSIIQDLIEGNASTASDTLHSISVTDSTHADLAMSRYNVPNTSSILAGEMHARQKLTSIDGSHFLVLNATGVGFHTDSPALVQEALGFGNVSNGAYSEPSVTSSADQYFAFSDCVQTVDPNVVMAIKSPQRPDKMLENAGQDSNTNSDDDDGNATQSGLLEGTGGSARTDCNAYKKLRIQKQWGPGDEMSVISPKKKCISYKESIDNLIMNEMDELPADQASLRLPDCVGQPFENSTINLGDLA